jgi:hypothetical protein
MAAVDVIQKVKSRLYGFGVGEQPVIVRGAANASETVTAPIIVFSVYAGEGSKIAAGDVLSVINAADADSAYMLYVLSVATDAVTAVMGHMGSPSPTTADDLDGALFELNPLKSEWMMWQMAESVVNTLLWPQVYKYNKYAVTPDLSDYQVELNANVEEIEGAWQEVGGEFMPIAFDMRKNLSTSISSTGVLGELYAIDGSSVFITVKERYALSDTLPAAVEDCIATGAAALVLGASRSSTDLEASSKDSQFRGSRNPADSVWRDFITLRSAINEDLAREVEWFEYRR